MSDFDINTPTPDDGHEAIRLAVVTAIENLNYNTGDVSLSLSLADTLFSLLDALTTRVAALEPPPAPAPTPAPVV